MKLVKEILYEEQMKFKQDNSDPIKDMNIGVEESINRWLKFKNITDYRLTKKYEINVYNNIILENEELEEFPEYIKFNHIMGGFHVKNNKLSSLKGVPYSVSGSFIVSRNNLSNLKFGPYIVKEIYGASHNNLETLEGIAKIIGGSIYLNDNNLKNLKHIPEIIHGTLNIQDNPINSLNGFPKIIEEHLYFTPSEFLDKQKIKDVCEVKGYIVDVPYKK